MLGCRCRSWGSIGPANCWTRRGSRSTTLASLPNVDAWRVCAPSYDRSLVRGQESGFLFVADLPAESEAQTTRERGTG
jgi:hypothetical protein